MRELMQEAHILLRSAVICLLNIPGSEIGLLANYDRN